MHPVTHLILSPQEICWSPNPSTLNATTFGNRMVADIILFRWGTSRGGLPIHRGWSPHKKMDIWRLGKKVTWRHRIRVPWHPQLTNTRDCQKNHQKLEYEGFIYRFWRSMVLLEIWFRILLFKATSNLEYFG